ncbi:hypothetical protein F4780DRAFT_797527 [Xylariomycetidae sp. FL0641]|nr:hypothetical protein F4780DRAFT_797527 [Xylariomycetidae sp. FL0641]
MSSPSFPLLATPATCADRTFIVTGANQGLGLVTAQHLVAAGARKVVLGVRNVAAGASAASSIAAATGRPGVVANAGILAAADARGADGRLAVVTVNVFGNLLLAALLLPALRRTADRFGEKPHLTVVGSSYGFYMQQEWLQGPIDRPKV